MSRAGSTQQAGPSTITDTNAQKRSAYSDSEDKEAHPSSSLKKRKTEESDTASPTQAESSKKKRRKKKRKISVTVRPLKPTSSLAMRLVKKPESVKSSASEKSAKVCTRCYEALVLEFMCCIREKNVPLSLTPLWMR